MDIKPFEHFLNVKEKDWKNYMKIISEDVSSDQVPHDLTKLLKDIELAKVVYFHLKDNSLNWCNQSIPALNDQKPIDFVNSEESMKILKGMLMRMH